MELQNTISSLQNIANVLVKDYNYYKSIPKSNAAVLSIKLNQVNALQNCINALTELNSEQNNVNSQQTTVVNQLQTKIFKLEACLFYYGVSLFEINLFMQQPEAVIAQTIKQNIEDNAFYKPLLHTVNKLDEVKYATKPCFNFNQLKNKALND